MPLFNYQATGPDGALVNGAMEAPDSAAVVERLRKDNFFPVSVEKGRSMPRIALPFSFGPRRMPPKELLNFTRQMATLLRSGLELDRCLVIMQELTEHPRTRAVIKAVQKGVHEGDTLSAAMAKQSGAFSTLYLSMVRAGEAGGFLEKIFDRLSVYLESRMKLVESVRSALIYPAVLAAAGFGAMAVLMIYVVPKFAKIFEGMGAELPAATRFLVWFSAGVGHYWFLVLTALVAAVFGARRWLSTPAGKLKWDTTLLKLPLIGDLVRKTVVAQFTRMLGTLLQSGVPITQALAIVKDTVANKAVASLLDKTAKGVKEGKKVSTQIKESGLFPALAVHMILVGEESGTMDEMLVRVAQIYDEEVEVAVKRIITLLEPAMILIMGLAVAFVVVSMLTAIFSVNDLPM
ncbi:MAG: type II secretion system F family protein [Nitrospinae bacterium]|nr:type II secretion system F family protein [Nitrospinota bacterium]